MKSFILSLALSIIAATAFAADPNLSAKAVALNLNEVANSIEYPAASNTAGVEGTVLMYVEIDKDGKITNKTALAYPCMKIKESVEKSLDDLEFVPAKDASGQAVASALRIPFEFKLTID